MRSSAIFLVSVVTSTRSSRSARSRISCSRSSIWPLVGLSDDLGVDQAGRPDDLLDDAVGLGQLVGPGGRRQVDGLPDPLEELLPLQRPVVHRAGQPEAVLDEGALAGHVALVHRADLRHRHVRLVDDEQEVLGEVVEQAVGGGAAAAAVDVHRVVLDAGAGADLAHHLDVVGRAHAQPLGLEQLALLLEQSPAAPSSSGSMPRDRALHPLRAGDVVRGREDVHLLLLADDLAGERVQRVDPLDLVAEELDADRELLVDRDDLDGVAAHPERAAGEGEVVAGVLHLRRTAAAASSRSISLADLAGATIRSTYSCGVPRP